MSHDHSSNDNNFMAQHDLQTFYEQFGLEYDEIDSNGMPYYILDPNLTYNDTDKEPDIISPTQNSTSNEVIISNENVSMDEIDRPEEYMLLKAVVDENPNRVDTNEVNVTKYCAILPTVSVQEDNSNEIGHNRAVDEFDETEKGNFTNVTENSNGNFEFDDEDQNQTDGDEIVSKNDYDDVKNLLHSWSMDELFDIMIGNGKFRI